MKAMDDNQLRPPLSALAMVGDDTVATAAVRKFAAVYPGRESVVFTNELLTIFDETKEQTEGFHLFFGVENGQFIPMIVHTDIDRKAVENHNTDKPEYYRADFTKAYFWDNAARRWQVVVDSTINLEGTSKTLLKVVKMRILANRHQFHYDTKGYYLSKHMLVNAWKSTGRRPITLLFQLDRNQVHLICPFYGLYKAAEPARKMTGTGNKGHSFPLGVYLLHTGGPGLRRTGSHHTPIRPCPSYCGDEALTTTK
ncbi:hypothetical protein J2I47_09410 [Fibrella sp. HMF5335]|uniref:Uncharacterized protein n=1 Tax=Fibrella rubiginis TaxID=2817060 RepID=A0A939K4I6_9BACT|nr:hypothetical protein [Fibrella rubiginis]MBO0936758.1 hypothetical protein [Fibrella rubiginis]